MKTIIVAGSVDDIDIRLIIKGEFSSFKMIPEIESNSAKLTIRLYTDDRGESLQISENATKHDEEVVTTLHPHVEYLDYGMIDVIFSDVEEINTILVKDDK